MTQHHVYTLRANLLWMVFADSQAIHEFERVNLDAGYLIVPVVPPVHHRASDALRAFE